LVKFQPVNEEGGALPSSWEVVCDFDAYSGYTHDSSKPAKIGTVSLTCCVFDDSYSNTYYSGEETTNETK
jgi:hypothetical protein